MKIFDISVPLQSGMPVWDGDADPKFEQYAFIDEGSVVNSTSIHSSAHLGTHVDTPRHLFNDGRTIDQIPLDTLIGTAVVIELNNIEEISSKVLTDLEWVDTRRVLFKTRNSVYWKSPRHKFKKDFVSLTPDGAQFLVERNVKLVGIDYLSIDLFHASQLPAHKILLEKEVVVIEGLNLMRVSPGEYELYCLPLKIMGSDGAPARAILKTINK
jgi:arylformamidase